MMCRSRYCHILLEPIAFNMDVQTQTPIIAADGKTVGMLHIELMPCAPDGSSEQMELVESPDQLLGR
jgi:hypothetical protein